jgi:OFA family oxalate/formate antiporter-like MFS transporter
MLTLQAINLRINDYILLIKISGSVKINCCFERRDKQKSMSMTIQKKRGSYLIAGCLGMFVIGIIYTWSFFTIPLSEHFPQWTIAQLSMNFTLVMTVSTIGNVFGAYLSRVFSKAFLIRTGACLIAFGLLLLSLLEWRGSLVISYLGYGVFLGLGIGITNITILDVIQAWYPERCGLVTGIALMMLGFGSLCISFAVEVLTGFYGVFYAFRIIGVAVGILLFTCSFWMKLPPGYILEKQENNPDIDGEENLAPRNTLRRASF